MRTRVALALVALFSFSTPARSFAPRWMPRASIVGLCPALCAAEAQPAAPRLLTVKKDGTGTYPTIQACANAAKPGDICLVYEGVYDERVTVSTPGAAGKPITFKASGKVVMQGFEVSKQDYISMDGFDITTRQPGQPGISMSSSRGSTISNNHIHHTPGLGIAVTESHGLRIIHNDIEHTGKSGIKMSPGIDEPVSEDVLIQDNTITYGGDRTQASAGIQGSGKRLLIERNDISHVRDFICFMVPPKKGELEPGSIVIRNNVFHDVLHADYDNGPHIDGAQGSASHVLLEGNRMYNVHEKTGGHVHFALFSGQLLRGMTGDTGYDTPSDGTIRYNVVNGIDSCFADAQYGHKRLRIYNNTVVRTNSIPGVNANCPTIAFEGGSTDGAVLNNLFYNATGANRNLYLIRDTSATGLVIDYNLGYHSAPGGAWNPGLEASYRIPAGADAHSVYDKDPLFRAYADDADYLADDFSLQDASPAKDAGGALTTLVTASGKTTVQVANAGFFQAGWAGAGVQADWIAVGAVDNVAQIAAIDYAANTITLAGALLKAVKPGDAVWLYKKSDGVRVLYGNAPDIGAYEWGSPPPPGPASTPSSRMPAQETVKDKSEPKESKK